MMTTAKPARFSSRTASMANEKNTRRSSRSRYPASSSSVPSRSRNTAGLMRGDGRRRPSALRVEPADHGLEHHVHADAAHAAMVDRTVAQHAGAAEHLMNDHVVVTERRGDPFVGGPEDRRHRHADRRRQVHRAGIVGHEGVARGEQPRQQPQIGPADQVDDARAGRQRRFYLTAGVAVAAGADQHTGRAARAQPADDAPRRDPAATAWRGRRPRRERSRRAGPSDRRRGLRARRRRGARVAGVIWMAGACPPGSEDAGRHSRFRDPAAHRTRCR